MRERSHACIAPDMLREASVTPYSAPQRPRQGRRRRPLPHRCTGRAWRRRGRVHRPARRHRGGCPPLSASPLTRARGGARSRRSPSRGWSPAGRSFAPAFAPASAPRLGMASGALGGHAAPWRGIRRAHMRAWEGMRTYLDRSRCRRARDSWRPGDGLRDGPSDGTEGRALACGARAKKKEEVSPPPPTSRTCEMREEWRRRAREVRGAGCLGRFPRFWCDGSHLERCRTRSSWTGCACGHRSQHDVRLNKPHSG